MATTKRKKKTARKFARRPIGGERLPETPASIVRAYKLDHEAEPMVLHFIGYGAFPYDCIAKDEFPDAAVYGNDTLGVWDAEKIEFDGNAYLPIGFGPLA